MCGLDVMYMCLVTTGTGHVSHHVLQDALHSDGLALPMQVHGHDLGKPLDLINPVAAMVVLPRWHDPIQF